MSQVSGDFAAMSGWVTSGPCRRRDLDRARCAEDILGHFVLAGGDVLPLVRQARPEHRGQRGLGLVLRPGGGGRRRSREAARARCACRKARPRPSSGGVRAGRSGAREAFRAVASCALDSKPTTARDVSGRARGAARGDDRSEASAATRRAGNRGMQRGGVGVQAARRAGKGLSSVVGRTAGVRYPCSRDGIPRSSDERARRVRVSLDGAGESNVSSGLPVLDHLLGLLARYGSLDLELQVAPERAEAEIAAAGKALGEALREPSAGRMCAVTARQPLRPTKRLHTSWSRPPGDRSWSRTSTSRRRGSAGSAPISWRASFTSSPRAAADPARAADRRRRSQHVLEAIFKALGVAIAQAGQPRKQRSDMEKTAVRTENAPAPFQGAPYSQAIKANGFVFVSGQLGLTPGPRNSSGEDRGADPEVSTTLRRSSRRRKRLDRIVKTTVFLASLDDFQGMNSVYAERMGDPAGALDDRGRRPSVGRARRDRSHRPLPIRPWPLAVDGR